MFDAVYLHTQNHNSARMKVNFSTLPVLAILSFLPTTKGSAQIDSLSADSTYLLREVEISDNRISSTQHQSNAAVEIITKADIAKLPVKSANELLSYVAGVDIRQRGAMGTQGDISLRGGTFEQTLVMINGIKISDPQTGHHQLNLPVSIENIERIEIIKGAATRQYGQNAFAGAINIITKVADVNAVSLSAFAGDWALFGGNVSMNFGSKNNRQLIAIDHNQSSGYRYNSDFAITNLFYQSSYTLKQGKLAVMGGYSVRDFGANGFYASPAYRDQYEKTKAFFGAIQAEKNIGKWRILPRVYARNHVDYYALIRNRPEVYENNHESWVAGAEVHVANYNKFGVSGLGIDYRYEGITSSNLGNHHRNLIGLFAEHRYSKKRMSVTPGVYVNYYSDWGLQAFPGIDAGYNLSASHRLFASAGRSYRIPTYTDLYYVGPTNIGNTALLPEKAMSYELGWKCQGKRSNLQASIFQRNGSRVIDWIKTSDNSTWQPQNLNTVIFNGFEFSSQVNYGQLLHLPVVATATASYTFLAASLQVPDATISRYALENLRHQVVVKLENQLFKNVYNQLVFRYLDRVSMTDFSVVDNRLSWKTNTFSVYAEATNLFNVAYNEAGFVPMPGRWFRAGMQYRFKLKQ